VIAALISIATGGLPIATLLLVGLGLGWYVGPAVSFLLILLALVIDLRARRQAPPQSIPAHVLETAQQRFRVPRHEEGYTGSGDRAHGAEALQRARD
jgi:hypothetical protein